MKFRLTYEGPLPSTQRAPQKGQADPRADVKFQMRRRFNEQLRRLWDVNPNLVQIRALTKTPSLKSALGNWHFCPLISAERSLTCAIDVLMLRPSPSGHSWYGDVDNRVKTLVDALTIPTSNEGYDKRMPGDDEEPFHCLLADDKLLTGLSLTTDEMLDFDGCRLKESDVRLIITVKIGLTLVLMDNLAFV